MRSLVETAIPVFSSYVSVLVRVLVYFPYLRNTERYYKKKIQSPSPEARTRRAVEAAASASIPDAAAARFRRRWFLPSPQSPQVCSSHLLHRSRSHSLVQFGFPSSDSSAHLVGACAFRRRGSASQSSGFQTVGDPIHTATIHYKVH